MSNKVNSEACIGRFYVYDGTNTAKTSVNLQSNKNTELGKPQTQKSKPIKGLVKSIINTVFPS